jgi:nucleoid-associated protein YgaU
VVPRKPKLIAAAAVIATGFLLAWPLRRSEELRPRVAPAIISPAATSAETAGRVVVAADARQPLPATTVGLSGLTLDSPFSAAGGTEQTVTAAKPIYDDAISAPGFPELPPGADQSMAPDDAEAREQIHIVHSGDSLERLAKRYLGDEGRAIELFDHNRQVLENPHLLPIGAELRIPASPASPVAAP